MKYKIITMLRSGIKDNAGAAVTKTLNRINFDTVTAVPALSLIPLRNIVVILYFILYYIRCNLLSILRLPLYHKLFLNKDNQFFDMYFSFHTLYNWV